jgi:ASC-1-like (ASCH) protein
MKNHHLAILKKPYLEAIIEGRKTIESRFTKTRWSGFGQIQVGDEIFLKLSSGPVCAKASAAAVKHFENLTPKQILQLKHQYNHSICGDDNYWESRAGCKSGFLVWLENVKTIDPIHISKKDWRAWVVLTEKENFGLLKEGLLKQP